MGRLTKAVAVEVERLFTKGLKHCSKCGETKPLDQFHKSIRHKNGYYSQCKQCKRQYYETQTEEIAAQKKAYYEANKGEIVARRKVYCAAHKGEIAAYGKIYRQTPRGKAVAFSAYKKYRQTARGKAMYRAARLRRRSTPGGYVSGPVVREIRAASNGICPYCGEPFDKGEVDHIIPSSKGGMATLENLVYVCASCNSSKNAKSLDEFMAYTGRLALIPVIDKTVSGASIGNED